MKHIGTRPKKRFGQHFLVDQNIVRKILDVSEVERGDVVLEIGPGLGVLTERLLQAGAKVFAVEIDRRLCEALKERFPGEQGLEIINKDILDIPLSSFSEKAGKKIKVVSNLPYNISGAILAKFIDERNALSDMTLMLQKEVAKRLIAKPSTKDYGILSVLAQAFFETSYMFEVSPMCFKPPPKVMSGVVRLKVLSSPLIDVLKEEFFKKVVKTSFGKRRKTIFNCLKAFGMEDDSLRKMLSDCKIDPKRRGETLGLSEFRALANALDFCGSLG